MPPDPESWTSRDVKPLLVLQVVCLQLLHQRTKLPQNISIGYSVDS